MSKDLVAQLRSNADYQQLVRSRRSLAKTLTIITLIAYYGLILLIAFAPQILGTPVASGWVTTLGMPIGVGVILISFILTAIYVRVANSTYDPLVQRIKEQVK